MAKKKFKTAKSRDFPHVCIKREKLGLLPSYVMTLSFLARPKKKKTIGYAACSACTKSRSFQHPEVSNVSKRQFHRFCHHNSVETCRNYENPESIIHSKTHTHTNCAFDAKTSWHLKFEIYIISYYFYVWTAAFPLWYFNVLHIFVWWIDTSTNCIIWYHLDIIWTLWVRSIANSLQHVPCALPCTGLGSKASTDGPFRRLQALHCIASGPAMQRHQVEVQYVSTVSSEWEYLFSVSLPHGIAEPQSETGLQRS